MRYLYLIIGLFVCPSIWGQHHLLTAKEFLGKQEEIVVFYRDAPHEMLAREWLECCFYLTFYPQSKMYTLNHRYGTLESGIFSQSGDSIYLSPKSVIDLVDDSDYKVFSVNDLDDLINNSKNRHYRYFFQPKKFYIESNDSLVQICTNNYEIDTCIEFHLKNDYEDEKTKEETIENLNKQRRSYKLGYTRQDW